RPLGIGVTDQHEPDGLRIREDSLELERAEEERLIGDGPLLHDAGDAGEIEIKQTERLRAPEQLFLADREREGAVEGNDEGPLRRLDLELPEGEEQERFDPRILVEATIADMPVRVLVPDAHRGGTNERREGGRRSGRGRYPGRAGVRVELDRRHGSEK